ncbi:MAG: NimC/NimA family protein [Clostridiales bacterium]|nr:NimC/NimA family protein [Clostridiales bacterium]
MTRAYTFLKECGIFYVLTVNEGRPAGRPFGALYEKDDRLYITTGRSKDVYRQIKACPQIELVGYNPLNGNWIRMDALAAECTDKSVREDMLDALPTLKKLYSTAGNPEYVVFELKERRACINSAGKFVKVD